jgi:putative ABC transport system permease protein
VIFVKNLLRNKIRTVITLLGVAFAISAFVSLTSISKGFKTQMGDIIRAYSIDVTVSSKGAATPMVSSISSGDYEGLRRIKGVRTLSCLIVGAVRSPWNPYFLLFGLSSVESFFNKLGIVEGEPLDPGKKEIMIGQRAAEQHRIKVNDMVSLSEQDSFRVAAIYTSGSRVVDGAAVLDISDARKILRKDETVNMAFIQAAPHGDVQGIVSEVNGKFKNLTAIKGGDLVGQIRLIKTVDVFVWAISIIAFVTCCFMVMNTFAMAVSERTGEIGILRAVGWNSSMVIKMVLSESLVLCLLGGFLGNLLALGELWLFRVANPEGLGWLVPTSVSSVVFVGSMGLSLLLGVAGSLYPAIRASRFVPADALRYER